MNDIKLSPKYGLNPTIPLCFFCGKPKNEIACFGKIGKRNEDIEAPHHCIINYIPCDECKKHMDEGVTLIAVENHPLFENQPPIVKNYYPNNKYVVLTKDAIERIITQDELKTSILKNKMALIDNQTFEQLTSSIAE